MPQIKVFEFSERYPDYQLIQKQEEINYSGDVLIGCRVIEVDDVFIQRYKSVQEHYDELQSQVRELLEIEIEKVMPKIK